MTLFSTPDVAFSPARSRAGRGTQQWRAEALYLCNWGGFGGHHQIRFDPESTLLAGASGAGKSTVLDAITLLMQQPGTSLNTASNETTGRGRKQGSRTALTYARGQYAWTAGHDGELRPQVLRGDGHDTWSAVALVFVADTGEKFTLLRLLYAAHIAARATDIPARWATFEGSFDLSTIEPWAREQFPQDRMKKAIPGLEFFPSYVQYAERFQSRLGIGEHGDGAKALRLLANIQRGHRVDTVDGLYKQMVLERPGTYGKADTAVESFDRLDDAHKQMRRAEQQIAVLDGMVDEYDGFIAARDTADAVTQYRPDDDRSPFALWKLTRKFDLFESEVQAANKDGRDGRADVERLERELGDIEAEQEAVDQQWRDAGGDSVGQFENQLRLLGDRRAHVSATRQGLREGIAVLDIALPDTADQHGRTVDAAKRFLDGFADGAQRLIGQANEHVRIAGAADARKRAFDEEIASLSGRSGNIEGHLHALRMRFADAAGLTQEDLPFVGELLDVHEDFEDWRVAADAVLGGFARTLLVDERHRRHLRQTINVLKDRVRLRWTGVDVDRAVPDAPDAGTLAGRLVVQDGPFCGWLRAKVNADYRHVCVETADELGDDATPKVTRAGQTQENRRGAHGGHQQRIIGFANADRIADLQAASDAEQVTIAAADAQAKAFRAEHDDLRDRKAAWEQVQRSRWDDLDLERVDTEIRRVKAAHDAILASGDRLPVLKELRAKLKERHREKVERIGVRRNDAAAAEQRWTRLCTQQDALLGLLTAIEDDPAAALADQQGADLDEVLSGTGWSGTLDTFDTHVRQAVARLNERHRTAMADMTRHAEQLTSRFVRFQEKWEDPNRGTGLASYDDYLGILTALTEQGLAQQRANWARKVIEWGGEDLAELHRAYDSTISDIEDRLGPVNAILAAIPFGGVGSTLRIDVTRDVPMTVRQFKEQLRNLASGSMNPATAEDQITERFEAIRQVISRIRYDKADPQRTSPEYDALLDVRRHITIRAQQLDAHGVVTEWYAYLGDKSGGETQELIAFIVGAALRYQLGDQNRQQPRFTPVVLDEGFIKADSRLAGRAVDAWKRLGFQLIIGAPEGQFTALERAMNLIIAVTKDGSEQSYAIPMPKSA